MAGPALPINRTTASTIAEHVSDHNAANNVVNKIEKDATPSSGQVLAWNGTVYFPTTIHSNPKTPEQYGAVGDGVTDDTTALNAWATAGGNLYLPPKTYLHNGATRPRITVNGTTLRGAGPGLSKIKSTVIYNGVNSALDIELFVVGNGVGATTSDVTIDGVGFEFSTAGSRGGGACLRVSRTSNLKIVNCSFKYSTYGIVINRAHDFEIAGCEVESTAADGIQCNNGSDASNDFTVKNGDIHDNYLHATGDDAIAVGGTQGTNRTQPENVIIHHNLIRDCTVAGGGIGIYGIKGCRVDNNRVENTFTHCISVLLDNNNNQYPSENVDIIDNDIFCDQTPGGGNVGGPVAIYIANRNTAFSGTELDIPFVKNLRVAGNRIRVDDRSGIWCQPNSTMGSHPNKWPDTVVIDNNHIELHGTPPAFVYRGIHMQYVKNLTIRRNRIQNFPHRAVVLNQFTNLHFTDNQIIENVGNATYSGEDTVEVGVTGTATDTISDFSYNTFRKTSGTANRMLNLRADGSAGTFPYHLNRFFTTGATITTAVETFTNRPTDFIGILQGSTTYDPPSLATGAAANTTVTVTGAAAGDTVVASHSSIDTAATSWIITGYVSAANTVRVVILNVTGGTVDLASGTLRVRVFKQ